MSKEPKKKPGDMARARKIHLQNQARRDAIAKLRAGETIEVWAHYATGSAKVRARPFIEEFEPLEQQKILCIFNGRLRVMVWVDHNGWHVFDGWHDGYLKDKQLLGIVTDVLETKKCEADWVRSARDV